MVKKQQSRVQKLEFLLKQMDKIHLRDAAEMLDVSEMTLRRDLSNDSSNVVLLGGYIVMNPQKIGNNYQSSISKHAMSRKKCGWANWQPRW